MTNLAQNLQHPVFSLIGGIADSSAEKAYVIGGFVRDLLLKRECKDIDIVVIGNGVDLAHKTAAAIEDLQKKKCRLSIFKNFGTAMLHYDDIEIEFVGARKESYESHSRKPAVENGSFEDDLHRRDFTINALAIGLNEYNYGELIDTFGGLEDLKHKIIKTPLDPDITFSDDPLRILRAIRFASQLKFDIDPDCFAAIKRNAERLNILSAERIAEELNKILKSPKPSYGFKLMDAGGILYSIFPELAALKGVDKVGNHAHKEVFEHTLEVLDNVACQSDDVWLRWAALLHDIAKPLTKKFEPGIGWTFHGHEFIGSKMLVRIFKRFRLPLNEKMRFVEKMILLHLRPIVLSEEGISDSAIRRLLFEAAEDIDSLMLLCRADITSKNKEKVKKYMSNFALVEEKMKEIEEKDHIRNFQPPITGEDIMEYFSLPPCREVGLIKTVLKDSILDGIIPNEREAARELMKKEGAKLGLQAKERSLN